MQSFTTMQNTVKFQCEGSPYQQIGHLDPQRRCLHSMAVPTTEHDISMITVRLHATKTCMSLHGQEGTYREDAK